MSWRDVHERHADNVVKQIDETDRDQDEGYRKALGYAQRAPSSAVNGKRETSRTHKTDGFGKRGQKAIHRGIKSH